MLLINNNIFFFRLIDCILFENAPVCISISPTNEFLATAHVNQIGIYVWSNKSLNSYVSLKPLESDYVPSLIEMPTTDYNFTCKSHSNFPNYILMLIKFSI